MQVESILNRIERHAGFVYEQVRWAEAPAGTAAIEVLVRPRARSRATCSGCGKRSSGYDSLPARRFQWKGVRVAFIQAPFLIERGIDRAPPKPPEQRRQTRDQKSKPIVEKFTWCDEHRERALEGSPLHDAIRYATNQKAALERFLEDPRLPIHNNISELNLRRQAVGRRNWIFVGSEDGGKVNTIFVSLLAICAMHKIEP